MPHFTWRWWSGRIVTNLQSRRVRLQCNVHISSRRWHPLNAATSHPDVSGLPQQLDLLERYRGLVALGRVSYDEEQVRVIAQLRRLQRKLDGYAPPALASRYLQHSISTDRESNGGMQPWWKPTETFGSTIDSESDVPPDQGALVRILTHAEEIAALTTPKGLLLTGPPGSGKSFLIDLWYAAMPTPYKARKHYSELVLEVYRAVWEETRVRMASVHSAGLSASPENEANVTAWTRSMRDSWRSLLGRGDLPTRRVRKATRLGSSVGHPPPIAFVVAQRLILRHWLLVFDEVQLLDVSSATLLADVLSWFWRMGGVVIGSSNKVPDDLYKNGVQRERLEPFVEALKARCPVVPIRSEKDWRVERSKRTEGKNTSWFVSGQEAGFKRRLASFVDSDAEQTPADILVFGRRIQIPWSTGGVCQFTFAQLCDQSLGPADYITLASTYHTVAIIDIPILKLSDKNQARRFISLIDALYEARCRIVCLAESTPEQLFFSDTPSIMSDNILGDSSSAHSHDIDVMMAEAVAETQDVYRPNVSSYAAPYMAEAPKVPTSALALDTLSIFSGKDEQFAFKRALSRLLEMTSESYVREETWAPLPVGLRKWECSVADADPPLSNASRSHTTTHWEGSPGSVGSSDFAGEASNVDISAPIGDRPEAPRLNEAHIWGVREDWGERAKEWGQGAKAYENSGRPCRTSSDMTPGIDRSVGNGTDKP